MNNLYQFFIVINCLIKTNIVFQELSTAHTCHWAVIFFIYIYERVFYHIYEVIIYVSYE